ncbi:MAG: sugar phosphate isomerase/epimerase [Acidobacteria bacterium]|nr:MAG: sugar phosphate isomerase/epimerase [Acidobacteriota bacterium]
MQRMNRRTFIGTSLAATLSAAAKPSWAAARLNPGFAKAIPENPTHKIARIGLQLYTVRAAMKTDFGGTIAKVAATGYKEVEFAGYYDHSPKEIRELLDKDGLVAPSCHVGYDVVEKKWSEALEAAKIVGHSYIICPWIDEKQRTGPDGWKRAADLFNKAGEESQKAGIQFGYHNHSFEFQPADSLGGKLPYDFLLAETDPKLVAMEMDLCWISVAGKDPIAYFDKYPGRFPLVHVKDWVKDASSNSGYQGAMGQTVRYGGHMADVGQGSIDWKNLFAHADKAGIQHYFVENDDPKSAFDDIKISYTYLRNLKF